MTVLYVNYRNSVVGSLHEDKTGRLEFQYSNDWLERHDAFPISLSLLLQEELYGSNRAHNFFANLLPEGGVRERICSRLKISAGNDVELLRAIGGDCAGALQIATTSGAPVENDYLEIRATDLAKWADGADHALSSLTGHDGIRLSLAGAQDKLPVKYDGTQFYLPRGNSPSTHLLKFATTRFKHLPANETLTTLLAKKLGLSVVDIGLYETTTAPFAAVTRYDREKQHGQVLRLHQEDACQSLGINPSNKYEKEGGPTLAQCIRIIKQHCTTPALEIESVLKWTIFNLLAGNSDAHGKNLSFLFTSKGTVTVAPFYDLVCTRAYPHLDRNLAMSIGGQTDPGQIGRRHWERFAETVEVRPSYVMVLLSELLDRISDLLQETVDEFKNNYGDSPMLVSIPRVVVDQTRRTRFLLTS